MVEDSVCQPKGGLEETRWKNLGDLILTLEQRKNLTVLREYKGRKSAELIKNSLEDLLEIDQVHKDLLEIDQVYIYFQMKQGTAECLGR